MSADYRRSVSRRVLKFFLGTDQPSFVAAAAGMSIALGILTALHAVYLGTRPSPLLWQTIGAGFVLGLFLLPFIFMAISRVSLFMTCWEALILIAAAGLFALVLRGLALLGVDGVDMMLFALGYIALAVAAFLTTRVIVKRHRSSL